MTLEMPHFETNERITFIWPQYTGASQWFRADKETKTGTELKQDMRWFLERKNGQGTMRGSCFKMKENTDGRRCQEGSFMFVCQLESSRKKWLRSGRFLMEQQTTNSNFFCPFSFHCMYMTSHEVTSEFCVHDMTHCYRLWCHLGPLL